MVDPFNALRPHEGVVPVDPDPAFAAELLARVTRALSLPKGVTVSDLDIDEVAGAETGTGPGAGGDEPARSGDIAYVSAWVADVDRAVAFYGSVLGWSFRDEAGGNSRQIHDIRPHHGVAGPYAVPTLFVCYIVSDLDEALGRVEAAGGSFEAPTAEPWGSTAQCRDNQSMAFALYTPPAGQWPPRWAVNGERHGDLSYVTMTVVDSALARSFYGSVLGWTFTPGRVDDGWGVDDVSVMLGISGGHPSAGCWAMYRVDDVYGAVERVRAAGGTATDAEVQPYGITSDCSDDQGTRFSLGQH
jgi:predicted enzyme related to lactoylglutathione lyase